MLAISISNSYLRPRKAKKVDEIVADLPLLILTGKPPLVCLIRNALHEDKGSRDARREDEHHLLRPRKMDATAFRSRASFR